jgi:hypothetical protein
MRRPTRSMSDVAEARLADLLGGRVTRGSGSHWRDQTDGKQPYGEAGSVYAWDSKSTLGKGITVTREMWAKVVEQAQERRPMLGLLWFRDERLNVETSLVAVRDDDFAELYERAAAADRVEAFIDKVANSALVYGDQYGTDGYYWLSQDLKDVLGGKEPSRYLTAAVTLGDWAPGRRRGRS